MPRDSKAYLWDVTKAADAISEFVVEKTYNDYIGNLLLRSAIERQFEVIGEALNQLSKVDSQLASRIPHLSEIVAFRNLLIHGYAAVNDILVWRAIHESLPKLRATVATLLEQSERS
jgi:uncharacterized protein with HEPN domain